MCSMAMARALVAGFLLTGCAFALNPSLDVSQYAHNSWRIRDGFVNGTIMAIAQTPDGYLWLGTTFGLVRFDGIKATPWQPPVGQELPSAVAIRLLTARDGTLWIGTLEGLASWKDGKLSLYEALRGRSIGSLAEDHEGTIWTGSYGKIAQICAVRKGSVNCEDGFAASGIAGILPDTKGNLWVGVVDGVWRWKPGPPKFYPLPPEPNGYRGLMQGEDGALLMPTRDGVKRLGDTTAELAAPFPASLRRPHPISWNA